MCSRVEGLRQENIDDAALIAIQTDLSQLKIPEKEKVLLELAEAMTLRPAEAPEYVRRASKIGWSNKQVANIVFLISLYNLFPRVVDAFDLPPDRLHPYNPMKPFPMLSCSSKKN